MSNPAQTDQALVKKATRAAYGETLMALAQEGVDIYAVDADLASSTTSIKLAEFDARRHINVGIAEQNMIGVAAGISLADPGKVVFTGSFAVFGTGRVYDQIRNTVCYAELNVKIAPTHAGISTGADGGSHQMVEDIALMRVLPNMRVLVPADYLSAAAAIRLAAMTPGPFYIRLGRLAVPQLYTSPLGLAVGQAQVLRPGRDVTIVASGIEVNLALEAANRLADLSIQAEVIDAFSIKPLDKKTIIKSAAKTGRVLTAEEHSIIGGLGSAVAELIAESPGLSPYFRRLGVEDRFGSSGEYDQLFRAYRLDSEAICNTVLELCNES
ncbi:MAG: transketolase family protein [Coriobacteriales bacterium]|jgi:transketolase|nr:transketolase family protein [Coriobacteriales bacterium]